MPLKTAIKPRFNTVSCIADPFNVRPAVDALERMIRARKPTPEKPVFVVMGEQHDVVTHILLRQALMARLITGASPLALAYGMEIAHNMLGEQMAKFRDLSRSLQARISEADRDGGRLLRMLISAYPYRDAQEAHKNILRFCVEHRISVRPNDVAGEYDQSDYFIDQKDALTRELVQRVAPDLIGQKLQASKPDAMALRNHMMMERAQVHARETGAAVYVQSCGLSHVFGSMRKERLYPDSLSAKFAAAGANVLPAFITGTGLGLYELPPGGKEALKESGLMIEALVALKMSGSNLKEQALIEYIARQSGGAVEVYSESLWRAPWAGKRSLEKEMALWIAKATLKPV